MPRFPARTTPRGGIQPCSAARGQGRAPPNGYQDYDGLLRALSDPGQDVSRVLGAADVLLPEALRNTNLAWTEPNGEPTSPIVAADPVQRTVIEACRRSVATVVDGPPGTGKSQVIVNLVADALRRGERVAVVCEKRAALDVVYQRLGALGLRHGVALVHDVHEDRKSLYRQVSNRLEGFIAQQEDRGEALARQREHDEVRAALDSRADALTAPGLELLTVGQLYTLSSGVAAPHLALDASLADVPKLALEQLLDAATVLHPLKDVWADSSVFRDPADQQQRPSLAHWGTAELGRFGAAIESALQASRVFGDRASSSPVALEAVALAQPALHRARQSRNHRSAPTDAQLFETLLGLANAAPAKLDHVTEAAEVRASAAGALARFETRVDFPESPQLFQAIQVLQLWAGSWLRFFMWAWWRARSEVRSALIRSWPERSAEPFRPTFTTEIHDRFVASKAWRVIGTCLAALGLSKHVPSTASALAPFLERLSELAAHATEVVAARPALTSAQAWPLERSGASFDDWDARIDERLALLEAHEQLLSSTKPVRSILPWVGELPAPEDLEPLAVALQRDGERWLEAERHLERARTLFAHAPRLLDELVALAPDTRADRWRSLIAAAWADAGLHRLEGQGRRLLELGSSADDAEETRQAERFAELERTLAELEVERILARMDRAELLHVPPAEKGRRRTPKQKTREELLKEAQKKSRVLPLRSFVRRFAAEGLLDLVPVWLLSPETMAILFPRDPLFDLIVFDEASQCTVEAGLPVLSRGRRIVVAGDEKQMPPSSYFALGGSTDEDDLAQQNDETERELRDMLAAESLLNLARSRVPHSALAWHYRCRDEALIAFSNHALYHGELLTIPATPTQAAPSAIHWLPVANGEYHDGANPPEAEAVVDLVHDLLSREQAPSIGIVTFNLKQRRAILDALDARCLASQAFARVWTDANAGDSLDQRPFVKNLENVQGDERDVIIFSLGHAPQARRKNGVETGEFYVPARFGPLGKRGGERRLNVAISRAKAECWVVASFVPSQLSVAQARHPGPVLFKQFLEFAHHKSAGRHKPADQILDLVREARLSGTHRERPPPMEAYVPLVVQIHDALEREGVPLQLNVGASRFRVPLAVLDPQDPTRFVLAILPEEGDPEEGRMSTFDRHVHRPSVLRERGWHILRVTSATWRKRRDHVIRHILELVPGAQGALDNAVWRQHREALATPDSSALLARSS